MRCKSKKNRIEIIAQWLENRSYKYCWCHICCLKSSSLDRTLWIKQQWRRMRCGKPDTADTFWHLQIIVCAIGLNRLNLFEYINIPLHALIIHHKQLKIIFITIRSLLNWKTIALGYTVLSIYHLIPITNCGNSCEVLKS